MSGPFMKRAIVASMAALAVAGAGTAIAASTGSGAGPTAFFDSVAKHLGVSTDKLQDATKAAATEQVDAALAAGTITEAQAAAIKERIASGGGYAVGPGFGGPHRGGGHLDDAATYLGLTAAELRTELAGGKTLAEVAEAQGKTVAELKAALLASEKQELAAAVADGRLTQAQADEILAGAGERFDAMIAGTLPARGGFGPGGHHGGHGFGLGSPAASAAAA